MLVEDCEPVARVLAVSLAESFEPIQHVVTLAAARALWHADPGAFDLVICGLDLPDGTGDNLRGWLNARTLRRVLFIIIAGSLQGVRRSRTDFVILSKPFCMRDLVQAINKACIVAASFPDLR